MNNKRLIALLTAVLMLTSMLCAGLQIGAAPSGVIENPPIDLPNATPTVDGNIDTAEGWSSVAKMNYDTLGFFWHVNPLTMEGDIRFAWDEENFYYCADIIDGYETYHEITGELIPAGTNSFIYSTGIDTIDSNEDTTYGYNGDIFGMMLDPLGEFINYGYTGNSDFTPWYLVGLFEGDVAKMYRGKINTGDITDQVQVAGHATEDGWCFEAAIPWDMIFTDIEDISFGEISLEKAEVLADGAHIRAAGMYMDRFYDDEAEEVATWGRFVTAPTIMADGNTGNGSSGDNALTLGINLYVSSGAAVELPFTDVKEGQWFYDSVSYCYQRNYISGTSQTKFSPGQNLKREQFVLILANVAGANLDAYADRDTPFTDVKNNAWYEKAVNWAYANEYASGMSDTSFGVGKNITREQLARFFYVYSEKNGVDVSGRADLSAYSDAGKISTWAKDCVEWAVDAGLISGMTETTIGPRGNATRAQAARMFMMFDKIN